VTTRLIQIADDDVPHDQSTPWLDPDGRIRADYLREDGKYRIVLLKRHSFSCPDHKDVTGGLEVSMESHAGLSQWRGGRMAPGREPTSGRYTGGTQPVSEPLYRLYAFNGDLLYVGITNVGLERFAGHAATKPWWSQVADIALEHYATRDAGLRAELRAIRTERPIHNIVGALRFRPKEGCA